MSDVRGARRLPLGFSDFEQFARFGSDLVAAMERQRGAGNALVIGSSTSGWSMNLRKPAAAFSVQSDIDVVLDSDGLLRQLMHANGEPDESSRFMGRYMWLGNDGPRGLLAVCPHISAFVDAWSSELGRLVDLRLLLAKPGTSEALDQMLDYGGAHGGGPIELIRDGASVVEL